MNIPRWSLCFVLITCRIITVSTLGGVVAFPVVGLLIKTDHSALQLAWLGAQTFGFCSVVLGPIIGLVLTARKIRSSTAAGAPNAPAPAPTHVPPKSQSQPDR